MESSTEDLINKCRRLNEESKAVCAESRKLIQEGERRRNGDLPLDILLNHSEDLMKRSRILYEADEIRREMLITLSILNDK